MWITEAPELQPRGVVVGLAVICLNVSVSFLAVGILGKKQEGGKSMESAEEKKKN